MRYLHQQRVWKFDGVGGWMTHDLENGLVDAIYAASIEPGRWPEALQLVADRLDAKGATIVFAQGDRSFGAMASTALAAVAAAYPQEDWASRDVVAHRAVGFGSVGPRDSFGDHDVSARAERETLPIYQFYQRFGVGQVGTVNLVAAHGLPASLSLHRSVDAALFNEEEMARLSAVGRHVEIALRLGIEIMERRSASGLLSYLLDTIKVGAVVLNPRGVVLHANKVAHLQLVPGLIVGEQIVLGNEAADRRLHDRFDGIGADTDPIIIAAADARQGVLAHLMPFKGSNIAGHDQFASAAYVAMFTPLSRNSGIDPSALRVLFGLTAGEARLASLAGQGKSVADIADRLAITQGTARLVLQRVFQKVGVSRHAELVARFAALSQLGTLEDAS